MRTRMCNALAANVPQHSVLCHEGRDISVTPRAERTRVLGSNATVAHISSNWDVTYWSEQYTQRPPHNVKTFTVKPNNIYKGNRHWLLNRNNKHQFRRCYLPPSVWKFMVDLNRTSNLCTGNLKGKLNSSIDESSLGVYMCIWKTFLERLTVPGPTKS